MKFINFTDFNEDHLWNVYMSLMVVNLSHHLLALDLTASVSDLILPSCSNLPTVWWKRKLKLREDASDPFPISNQYI